LLELVDPEREIESATPSRLNELLCDDVALSALVPLTDSWFEDTAETRKFLRRPARAAETKIWRYLEDRREIWARRFLQTAIILRSAKRMPETKTLAASAYALMQKHPLRKIPLMDDVVTATLEAAGIPV
jgi:hypothetical protein